MPAVCRTWRAAVHSPHLLRRLDVGLNCTNAAVLPSFCAWLRRRAAGHVQRLALELRADGITMHALRSEADAAQLFAAVAACGEGLSELHLRVDSQLVFFPAQQLGTLCGSLRVLRLQVGRGGRGPRSRKQPRMQRCFV